MTKKIAIVGARGINNYGGFETAVGKIAPALVKKGYVVYCSCEKNEIDNPKTYEGVNLIYFPLNMNQNYILRQFLEILYDIYFNIYCTIFLRCDLVYSMGVGANVFTLVPRLFGKKSFVNIDGLEWKRSKFSSFQKIILNFFFSSVLICSNTVIVDSKALKKYINSKYLNKVDYISYGVDEFQEITWNQSKISFDVSPNNYWVIVARLEPENNIHLIVKSYIESNSKMPLVIVGNFISIKYERLVKNIIKNRRNDKEIIFTGGIYDLDTLNMLRQNCFAYVHGHSVGGTNPSLLEAMIMKNIIIAHDNEFNREVAGNSVIYFMDSDSLKDKINLIEKSHNNHINLKLETYYKAKENYSWDKIIFDYEKLFKEK